MLKRKMLDFDVRLELDTLKFRLDLQDLTPAEVKGKAVDLFVELAKAKEGYRNQLGEAQRRITALLEQVEALEEKLPKPEIVVEDLESPACPACGVPWTVCSCGDLFTDQ